MSLVSLLYVSSWKITISPFRPYICLSIYLLERLTLPSSGYIEDSSFVLHPKNTPSYKNWNNIIPPTYVPCLNPLFLSLSLYLTLYASPSVHVHILLRSPPPSREREHVVIPRSYTSMRTYIIHYTYPPSYPPTAPPPNTQQRDIHVYI